MSGSPQLMSHCELLRRKANKIKNTLLLPLQVCRRLFSVCDLPVILDRNAQYVEKLYDNSWPSYSNLDLLSPGFPQSIIKFCDGPNTQDFRLVGDRYRFMGLHEYRIVHQDFIERTLREYLQNGDLCYEFGCGNGRNLLWLAMKMPDVRFGGCDISGVGVEIVRAGAERLGLKMDVEKLNYLSDPVEERECDVSFTHYSLEQVPRSFPQAVKKIIAATKRYCIFFEPIGELYPKNLRGVASAAYRHRQDYMGGLVEWLKSNGFHVIRAERTGLAPKIFCEMCVCVVKTR